MNNIKFQNLVIFSFEIRMKHKFSLLVNQIYIMKKSKHLQYFHCFLVCILGPYVFLISFQQIIVAILISHIYSYSTYQRESPYQREALISIWISEGAALICSQVLIRGNTACTYLCTCVKEMKASLKFLHKFYI